MTTYPGEDPQKPEDQPEDHAEPGTEPTQPVGYWERQAAEQARAQVQQGDPFASPSGAVFNPTSAQPSSGWSQPGDQNPTRPYEQGPYSQPVRTARVPTARVLRPAPYGQGPYGQPSYAAPAPGPGYGYPPPGGQSGMPPAPGYPPYAFAPPRPDHPQSNLALILGIVGLVTGFLCGLGFVISPFAWGLGRNAVKEIQASQGRLGGEGPAKAGMITGIVGTVFLAIGVLLLIGFAVLVVAGASSSGSSV